MLTGFCNNKGIGMVDAVMALCVVSLGVLSLLSLYPVGWSSARSSDERSRASEIMHRELENAEALIMNPCNIAPANGTIVKPAVNSSAQSAAQPGDANFTVNETFTQLATTVWRVEVTVTWPGTANGVIGSRDVTRQEMFRYDRTKTPPSECADGSVSVSYN